MLTSLDLSYLIRELQLLVGARLEKIYQSDEVLKRFVLRFKGVTAGKRDLLIEPPGAIHLTMKDVGFPDHPPAFCMFLRKHIQDCVLIKVEQVGVERAVIFSFKTKDGIKLLAVELFSKGNVILCNESLNIISALENQAWSNRTVRGGVKYELPVSNDVRHMSESDFEKIVSSSNRVKSLAVECGLGGVYAEEAIARARVPKEGHLSARQVSDLLAVLHGFFDEPLRPGLQCGRAVPFEFVSLSCDFVPADSFSAALDSIHVTSSAIVKENPAILRAKSIISDQESRRVKLEREARESVHAAELLYSRYAELDAWWSAVQAAASAKNWNLVKTLVESAPVPASVDLKTKIVSVEL